MESGMGDEAGVTVTVQGRSADKLREVAFLRGTTEDQAVCDAVSAFRKMMLAVDDGGEIFVRYPNRPEEEYTISLPDSGPPADEQPAEPRARRRRPPRQRTEARPAAGSWLSDNRWGILAAVALVLGVYLLVGFDGELNPTEFISSLLDKIIP